MRRFFRGTMTVLGIAAQVILFGGCSGPSKARLSDLLHECREANRERVRIIHEYDARPMFDMSKCTPLQFGGWICPTSSEIGRPSQQFGTVGFGEAGN